MFITEMIMLAAFLVDKENVEITSESQFYSIVDQLSLAIVLESMCRNELLKGIGNLDMSFAKQYSRKKESEKVDNIYHDVMAKFY